MIDASLAVLILLAFPLLLLLFAFVDEQRPNEPTMPYDDMLRRQLSATTRGITTERGERSRPTPENILNSFDPTYWGSATPTPLHGDFARKE